MTEHHPPLHASSHFRILVAIALVTAACAKRKPEAPTPSSTPPATQPGEFQTAATYEQVMTDVAAGEAAYMKMSIAAAGWLRHIAPGKSIGFFQPDLASPAFKDMVDQVTRTYAYRPIRSENFRMICTQVQAAGGQVTRVTPTCTMAMADAVMQFNSTKMSLDSGYVGGSVTLVPRGATAPEQKAFCITIARHGNDWIAVRSTSAETGRRCPR